jgi:hypothetical protein
LFTILLLYWHTLTAARVMVPEIKYELDLYEYVLIQTKSVPIQEANLKILNETSNMAFKPSKCQGWF